MYNEILKTVRHSACCTYITECVVEFCYSMQNLVPQTYATFFHILSNFTSYF